MFCLILWCLGPAFWHLPSFIGQKHFIPTFTPYCTFSTSTTLREMFIISIPHRCPFKITGKKKYVFFQCRLRSEDDSILHIISVRMQRSYRLWIQLFSSLWWLIRSKIDKNTRYMWFNFARPVKINPYGLRHRQFGIFATHPDFIWCWVTISLQLIGILFLLFF